MCVEDPFSQVRSQICMHKLNEATTHDYTHAVPICADAQLQFISLST